MSTDPDWSFKTIRASLKSSWIWLYCLVLSACFLLICTKSSPLYPFNDWVDANSFFTMGKGMINGKVLYRDLFEQKGPLLYFLHGLAYLVSNRTFLGVYFLEVLSFCIFLYYAQLLMRLFTTVRYALASLPFLAFIVLSSAAFTHGDSAEEYCLPLLTISLFHLLRVFKATETTGSPQVVFSNRTLLLNGMIAGCVLWIKFSLLIFWFGWMLAVLLNDVINKNIRQAVRAALIFLGGILLVTLPWIAYFGYHQAIPDWIDTYFLVNIWYYAADKTIFQGLMTAIVQIVINVIRNPLISLFIFAGLICFARSEKFLKSLLARASVVACFLLLIVGIYIGGHNYVYYYLIVAPFSILGFIYFEQIQRKRIKRTLPIWQYQILVLAFIVALITSAVWFHPNTEFMKTRKEDLVQFQFAAIINQSPDATLLNYGFLDMGFYTVTGLTPSMRFFQKQNIDEQVYPLNMHEQNRLINEKAAEFVVMRQYSDNPADETALQRIRQNYDLVLIKQQEYERLNYDYYLFRRRT